MSSPQRYKYRILYVGRDLALTALLKDKLKRLDCFVVRCPDGHGARRFIKSDIKYSLLLFDDELSDMTGLALAHYTSKRAHRAATPIVILSKEKARGMVAGLFFEKPYDVGSLVETITAVVRGRRLLPPLRALTFNHLLFNSSWLADLRYH